MITIIRNTFIKKRNTLLRLINNNIEKNQDDSILPKELLNSLNQSLAMFSDELIASCLDFYHYKEKIGLDKFNSLRNDFRNATCILNNIYQKIKNPHQGKKNLTEIETLIKQFSIFTKNTLSEIKDIQTLNNLNLNTTNVSRYNSIDIDSKKQKSTTPDHSAESKLSTRHAPYNLDAEKKLKTLEYDYLKIKNDHDYLVEKLRTTKIDQEKLSNLANISLEKVLQAIRIGNGEISANKLADSFSTRSKELDPICAKWLTLIYWAIGIIFFLAIIGLVESFLFNEAHFSIQRSLYHLPIFLSSFWGLWFCCKQYSYSCRLRDDYHYKYDLSIAFYGYHEEVKEVAGNDKTIQLELLDIVIKNIGKNPVDNKTTDTDCNSPYTEGIKKLNELMSEANKLLSNVKGSSANDKAHS